MSHFRGSPESGSLNYFVHPWIGQDSKPAEGTLVVFLRPSIVYLVSAGTFRAAAYITRIDGNIDVFRKWFTESREYETSPDYCCCIWAPRESGADYTLTGPATMAFIHIGTFMVLTVYSFAFQEHILSFRGSRTPSLDLRALEAGFIAAVSEAQGERRCRQIRSRMLTCAWHLLAFLFIGLNAFALCILNLGFCTLHF